MSFPLARLTGGGSDVDRPRCRSDSLAGLPADDARTETALRRPSSVRRHAEVSP
ncbi:hypothetical protein [Halarchaeum grantii]|uniref:hypothetical protein n=1 Tax=Halarchaeum grantii TaxID=1193105 RepID=UPI00166CE570|nr:hypothetical protein [Halarchaeum grantii]